MADVASEATSAETRPRARAGASPFPAICYRALFCVVFDRRRFVKRFARPLLGPCRRGRECRAARPRPLCLRRPVRIGALGRLRTLGKAKNHLRWNRRKH